MDADVITVIYFVKRAVWVVPEAIPHRGEEARDDISWWRRQNPAITHRVHELISCCAVADDVPSGGEAMEASTAAVAVIARGTARGGKTT